MTAHSIALLLLLFNLLLEANSRTLKILQLTDIHFDIYFEEGSSIYTSCHRKSGSSVLEDTANNLWGEQCDSSEILIDSTLKHVNDTFLDIASIFITGDSFRHDEDKEIPVSHDEIIWANNKLKSIIKFYFPLADIHFCLGNHDVILHDCLAGGPNSDIQHLKNIWLEDNAVDSFDFGGYQSNMISENVKIISINSLYFSKNNLLVKSCSDSTSPGALQLAWLENELKDAQFHSFKVIIIGHIPPIDAFYHSDCCELFKDIIWRYPNTVTVQIYGHTHLDDFYILKKSNIPFSFALTAPSVVPTYNPAYRVYYLDEANGSLLNYYQYYAPRRQQQNIEYLLEYECANSFGKGPMNLEYFIYILWRERLQSSIKIKRNKYRTVCY